MKIKATVVSHIGKVRTVNQDNFYFYGKNLTDPLRKRALSYCKKKKMSEHIFAIFDGMGGEHGGEVASKIASEKLKIHLKNMNTDMGKNFESQIKKFTKNANQAVCNESAKVPGLTMGTTYALLYLHGGIAHSANIGDSRVYLFRDNNLMQLSTDHNHAQTLLSMGLIQKTDAKYGENKNKLTQYLGVDSEELVIEATVSKEIKIQKGDYFIICSDGLTDMLTEDTISRVLAGRGSIRRKIKRLLKMTLENGASDNVTIILVAPNC